MASRPDKDKDVDKELFIHVLTVATKGAESATEVAAAVRSLENALNRRREDEKALALRVEAIDHKIDAMKEEGAFKPAMLALVKNPQIIILVLTLLAGAFGIKVSQDNLHEAQKSQGEAAP